MQAETEREVSTNELVEAWLESRARLAAAEEAKLAAYDAISEAQKDATAAHVALAERFRRLGRDQAHLLDGTVYWIEGGRVRELRLTVLGDPCF